MIDWDDAFDNSGYVAGSAQFAEQWAAQASEARARLSGKLNLSYGKRPRMLLDIFYPPGKPQGLVVFVHGGYWQRLDKSYWSHLAQGPVAHDWAVAIVNYPLAPEVRIADITQAVAQGITLAAEQVAGPIRLSGHSAGGHLVSRMMTINSPLPTAIQQRLVRVVSISGVHDLRPLTGTAMNQVLQLTDEEAISESPLLAKPLLTIPVTFWVGAEERPEFLRQNRLIAENWSRQGADVSSVYQPGHHHFSVVASLAEPQGALTAAVLA